MKLSEYKPEESLLKDRAILVTGAGEGIGRQAALSFAQHGATVILLGKTIPKLESIYDEIVDAGYPEPAIYPMHLTGAAPKDYQELADTLKTSIGHLDGILHNAASLPYLSRITDYDPEEWAQVIQTNLNAPFLLTQACLPLLQAAADASVVFTSDSIGRKARAFYGAYAVSKFGLEGLMQVLAEELENTAIRENSIDPGPTRTQMRKKIFPGEDMQQLKTPAALMPSYLWLIGPDSKGTHGQALSYSELTGDST